MRSRSRLGNRAAASPTQVWLVLSDLAACKRRVEQTPASRDGRAALPPVGLRAARRRRSSPCRTSGEAVERAVDLVGQVAHQLAGRAVAEQADALSGPERLVIRTSGAGVVGAQVAGQGMHER